jgi:hypothetical protein
MVSEYKENKMLRAAVLRLKALPEDHAMRYLSRLFSVNMLVAVKIGAKLASINTRREKLQELADIAVNECFVNCLHEDVVDELMGMKKGA